MALGFGSNRSYSFEANPGPEKFKRDRSAKAPARFQCEVMGMRGRAVFHMRSVSAGFGPWA